MILFADNWLMRTLEWAVGVPRAPSGEGRVTTLEWSAPWPPWVTLLLMLFATALVVYLYLRERTPLVAGWRRFFKACCAGLRIAVIALVVMMLYRPALRHFTTDLPDLLVIVDDSESMGFADTYDDPQLNKLVARRLKSANFSKASRINLAKSLLLADDADLLAQLREKYNIKIQLAGSTLRNPSIADDETTLVRDIAATQPSSRLGQSILDALDGQRGRPTAGIVLLTDGITTEGTSIADSAQIARRKGIPVFTVALGNEEPIRDVSIADLLVSDAAFVGDTVVFEIKVVQSGFDGESVAVRLVDQASGKVISEELLNLRQGQQVEELRLRHRPLQPGQVDYVVEVVAPDGDANEANNLRTAKVQIHDDTLRVLLVQAYPNFEFRFLKNMLSRQLKVTADENSPQAKAVELTTVLQSAHSDYAAQDETALPVFPVQRDELFKYDVLIFGDVDPAMLSQGVMENISLFVKERGGGVVFIAGPKFTPTAYQGTPLVDLMPMPLHLVSLPDPRDELTESFAVRPTAIGLASPHMQLADSPTETLSHWANLPGLYWNIEFSQLKPAVRVLAEHQNKTGADGRPLPIILLQNVGSGKVIFHTTDETWRWRFRLGDALFGRYWMQTIRFLSRAKLIGQSRAVEVTTNRKTYQQGEPVNLRVRFLDDRLAPSQDDGVTVVVEQQGGRRRRMNLQRTGTRAVFEGLLTNLPHASYRAWVATPTIDDGAPTTEFAVEASAGELARLQTDADELRKSARVSGGKHYTLATVKNLAGDLPEGRQVPIESLDPVPIWNSHLMAGLFVALLVTEWILRKRAGMI